MDQNPPRVCPNCGTPVESNQRFCSECGTTLSVVSNQPTAQASGEQPAFSAQAAQFATQPEAGGGAPGNTATAPTQLVGAPGQTPGAYPAPAASASGAQFYAQTTEANPIPPPPPPDSLIAPLYSPSQAPYQAPANTPSSPSQPAPGTYVVPDYARVPRRSRTGLVASFILLVVLALGGFGVYALFFNKPHNNTQGTQGNTPTQNSPVTNGNTPGNNVTATTGTGNATPGSGSSSPTVTTSTTTNGATTEQLNLSFTFSGIDLTITSVQYAQSFPDDTSNTSGVLRVSLNEKNATSANPRYYYPDIARLILADGSVIAPSQEKQYSNPDTQATASNWLDFPVTSQPADLSKLTLQMGTAQQNQMLIPLKAGADLSKYQPKTATPGTKFQYAGLNWTLKSATESYSVAGSQATNGNIYITLVVDITNPTTTDYRGYYADIARLSAGSSTNPPTPDSMFPSPVAAQSSATGTLVFLAPQGNTSFTLMMLAMPSASPPIQAVSVPFTIQ